MFNRRSLGGARERLAEARLAPLDLVFAGPLLDGLGHAVSSSASVASTSSITARTVSFFEEFSNTGTP